MRPAFLANIQVPPSGAGSATFTVLPFIDLAPGFTHVAVLVSRGKTTMPDDDSIVIRYLRFPI